MAAASLALRRGTASALFNRLVFNPNPIRSTPAAATAALSFNTDSQVTSYNEDGRTVDVQCSPDRSVTRRPDSVPTFFSDVFDPFSPTRTLSQVLNLMDQLLDDPLLSLSRGRAGGVVGSMRGWDVKEDNEALYLKINMPGLGKENVKVWVEQNTLVIKGEGEKESEKGDDDEFVPRYSSRIDLPPNMCKIDEIKAEMKNGVLKIVVPKVKEGEREDVKQVQVEG